MIIINAKLGKNPITDEVVSVTLIDQDGISYGVPVDLANVDYQKYLEWLKEGNTPEEAEPEARLAKPKKKLKKAK